MKIVSALNSLSTAWVAIIVMILGMVFVVICKSYDISSDTAAGVVGAGICLLTRQMNRSNPQPQQTFDKESIS